jgi:DNA invertase Pin-like site-specific DNA recombinase
MERLVKPRRAVAYYRVSTAKQGRSGLGLEAQRTAVNAYVESGAWILSGEFVEVESGKIDRRPQLEAALAQCELTGATLIVAKLDRLSRNVAFLATLQDAGTRFLAVDMPEANELTIHIMAAVAQAERKAISKRTKEALAAAKARGVKLGGARGNQADLRLGPAISASIRTERSCERARKVCSQITSIQGDGVTSLRQIAATLNARGISAPRGGPWSASQVRTALKKGRAVELVA